MRTRFSTLLFLLLLLTCGFNREAHAQVCTPDSSYTNVGTYPSILPDACRFSEYEISMTLVAPSDTVVDVFGTPTVVNIDSIELTGIFGQPAGIFYECQTPDCMVDGGGITCVRIYGTPTQSGTFVVDVATKYYVFGGLVLTDTAQAFFTMNVLPSVDVAPAITPASHCTAADGAITLNATGTGTLTYLWSTGATTDAITGLTPGVYDVDITDGDGCVRELQYIVNALNTGVTIDSANSNIDWIGCAETNGGTILPNISGGNAPFTYAWSDGSTSQTLMSAEEGAHTLTVTDNDGCITVQPFEITAPSVLEFDSMATQFDWMGCAADGNGSIMPVVSGGAAPYGYSWSNGDANADLDSVAAGTYTLTIIDQKGCSKSMDFALVAPTALEVEVDTLMDATCANATDGIATVAVSGGVQGYSFVWNNSPSTSESALDLGAGKYEVTVTDAAGCESVIEVTIGAPDSLVATYVVNNETEAGATDGSIELTAQGGTAPYSYNWNTGDTTDMITELSGDATYTVTVTDANGCEFEADIEVAVGASSIREQLAGISAWEIYPNPSNGIITMTAVMETASNLEVGLVDLTGKQIWSTQFSNRFELNETVELPTVPAGIYLITLSNGQGMAIRKIAIQ
ncbi:T9SS type A sorting domain-containing protein [Pontibacter sp. G13]|uniref:T9SS type A sorting domain-containing protein n=1 Tax=Pontibacter sp. G13 TaxID=3074898 RepID=UPI00288A6229|nr:T9SS type A sorting domain-containing protein [Pontibacter sp. G13]WNJ21368.1 T9SS type A sorting domain-containing protein [Pontibacter sp. G13]